MTPSQAAEIIGCSKQQVRTLIRSGKIKAKRIQSSIEETGNEYFYDIAVEEAERMRDKKQSRGWPRGKSRKQVEEN